MSKLFYRSLLGAEGVGLDSTPLLGQVNGDIFGGFTAGLGEFLPSLLGAVVILVVGVIIAYIARAITKGILNKTEIDNKIAGWIAGSSDGQLPRLEEWIAEGIFWIIIILTIVATLQSLQLDAVTEPLNDFLEGVIGFIPNVVGAVVLIAIAWIIATIVKLIVTRALHAAGLDDKLGQQMRDDDETSDATGTTEGVRPPDRTPPPSGSAPSTSSRTSDWNSNFSLSETVGNALYWFIFLLFLPSILSTLQLEGTLNPVQELLQEILAILPNILAAIIIAAAGWLVAQIVRRVVTNLLRAAGTDSIGAKIGLSGATRSQSLSWLIGTTVFVLILIPVAIASLNALEIAAIAAPAIAMLEQILNLLPKLFAAAVILVVAYIIGKYVSELLTSILAGAGFDNIFQWLGISSGRTTPTPAPERPTPETGQETTLQPSGTSVQIRTPSETVGIIIWVGIMLFATLAAVEIVNIPAVTTLVEGIILISGQILAGVIVFAIGLYLANLAFNFISSSSRQSRILAHSARIAIIALVTAMALEQIGIASNIVNLAFGLLLGAVAVAIALAFGLGSRDIAAEQVREWLNSFKSQ